MADDPLDRRIADRPDEANRGPDPPPEVDRRPPWEGPQGVIERLIEADRRREPERRDEPADVIDRRPADVVALLREIGARTDADPKQRRVAQPRDVLPHGVASSRPSSDAAPIPELPSPDSKEAKAEPAKGRDRIHLGVDRPEPRDIYDHDDPMPPVSYAEALREHPDGPRPLYDGPPRREHIEQGDLGDCGVMATLGAVAAHRPEAIERCVQDAGDGEYKVELHRVERRGDVCRATGETIRLDVPSEVPVFDHDPARPAFAQAPEVAWPAVLEKGIAGSDAAWTPQRRMEWDAIFERIKTVKNDELAIRGDPPLPDGPTPTGYARLNQGSHPWESAELLTQVTGEPAEVRRFPDGPSGDDALAAELEQQLADRKPVVAVTRSLHDAAGEVELPHQLQPSHVYEVTGVHDGKLHLHNPWNRLHPEPLTPADFREFFSPKDHLGQRRPGVYTTLQ